MTTLLALFIPLALIVSWILVSLNRAESGSDGAGPGISGGEMTTQPLPDASAKIRSRQSEPLVDAGRRSRLGTSSMPGEGKNGKSVLPPALLLSAAKFATRNVITASNRAGNVGVQAESTVARKRRWPVRSGLFVRGSVMAAVLLVFPGCSTVGIQEQGLLNQAGMRFEDGPINDPNGALLSMIEPGSAASGGARAAGCVTCR